MTRARAVPSVVVLVALFAALAPSWTPVQAAPEHQGTTPRRTDQMLHVSASPAPDTGHETDPPVGRQSRAGSWMGDIDGIVGDLPISVAMGNGGEVWYAHQPRIRRPPASNEKLLLSMALLDRFEPGRTIRFSAMTPDHVGSGGQIRGDLWLVGRGDPEIDPPDVARLASELASAGITRIRGDVIGVTGPFARDWWADGWKDYFPQYYIALPTALTFNRNEDRFGRHVTDPERRAAATMIAKLEALGIPVNGQARAARSPGGLKELASIRSTPLRWLIRHMNVSSRNFWAEVLGKYLGSATYGRGTIANGAAAIEAFAAAHNVDVRAFDGSGLSYANRVTAGGILRLLWYAESQPWGETLRFTLPAPGQGTLEDRLLTVRVKAKTGTLDDVSALSGWVWLERAGEWGEFSIMSSGYDEDQAKRIENQIVKVVARNATDPTPEG